MAVPNRNGRLHLTDVHQNSPASLVLHFLKILILLTACIIKYYYFLFCFLEVDWEEAAREVKASAMMYQVLQTSDVPYDI